MREWRDERREWRDKMGEDGEMRDER